MQTECCRSELLERVVEDTVLPSLRIWTLTLRSRRSLRIKPWRLCIKRPKLPLWIIGLVVQRKSDLSLAPENDSAEHPVACFVRLPVVLQSYPYQRFSWRTSTPEFGHVPQPACPSEAKVSILGARCVRESLPSPRRYRECRCCWSWRSGAAGILQLRRY